MTNVRKMMRNYPYTDVVNIKAYVKFYQFVLEILSGNGNLTSIKGHNSVTNLRKIIGSNILDNLDIVNINAQYKIWSKSINLLLKH